MGYLKETRAEIFYWQDTKAWLGILLHQHLFLDLDTLDTLNRKPKAERKSLQLEAFRCQQPQSLSRRNWIKPYLSLKSTWPESPRSGPLRKSSRRTCQAGRRASLFPGLCQQWITSRYVLFLVPCGCRSVRWWRIGVRAGAADRGRCESWTSSGCAWRRRRSWSSAAEENPPLPPPRLDRRGHRLEGWTKVYSTHSICKCGETDKEADMVCLRF